MTYVQEIILDLNPNAAPPIVFMKQGDGESRQLHIFVTENDEPYKLYHSAVLRIKKPDGNVTYTESSTPESDGSVYVTITAQSLAVSGRAYADLMLSDNEDNILSTLSFTLNIQPSPGGMDGIVSGSEYAVFSSMYGEAVNIINQAKSWAVGQTTGEGWGEAENNAKYYSEQAAMIVASFEENGIQLDAVASEPGCAPSVISNGNGYFTLQAPAVNFHVTGNAATGTRLGVDVSIASYSDVEAPQITALQKNINFDFTFPSDWGGGGAISVTTNFDNPTSSGLAADAYAIGSYVKDKAAFNTVISDNIVLLSNGGTGASNADDARIALQAQPIIHDTNISITSSDWGTVEGTIPSRYASFKSISNFLINSKFVSSPSNDSWLTAQSARMLPPVASSSVIENVTQTGLYFECLSQPNSITNVTVYWW